MATFQAACFGNKLLFVEIELRASGLQPVLAGARPSMKGLALVDTGATVSLIKSSAVDELGLISEGTAPLDGVTGQTEHRNTYDVTIVLLGNTDPNPPSTLGLVVDMLEDPRAGAVTFAGEEIALIGMDVLSKHQLTVDGGSRMFELRCLVH
jgi:Retroviral aspartyl protease